MKVLVSLKSASLTQRVKTGCIPNGESCRLQPSCPVTAEIKVDYLCALQEVYKRRALPNPGTQGILDDSTHTMTDASLHYPDGGSEKHVANANLISVYAL